MDMAALLVVVARPTRPLRTKRTVSGDPERVKKVARRSSPHRSSSAAPTRERPADKRARDALWCTTRASTRRPEEAP